MFSRPVFLSSRSCRKSLTETYRIKGHISTLAQGHTKSVGKNKTNKKTPKCQKKKTKPKEIKTTIIKTRNIFQFRHSSYVIKSHLLFRHLEKRKKKYYSPCQPKTGEYISAENDEKSCARVYMLTLLISQMLVCPHLCCCVPLSLVSIYLRCLCRLKNSYCFTQKSRTGQRNINVTLHNIGEIISKKRKTKRAGFIFHWEE